MPMSNPDPASPNTTANCDLAWAYAIAGLNRKATAADARRLLMQRLEAVGFCPDWFDDDSEVDRGMDTGDSAPPLDVTQCNALLAIVEHASISPNVRRSTAADESAWRRRKAAAFLNRAHTVDRDQRQQRLRKLKKSARFSSATRTRLRRVNNAMRLQGIGVDDVSVAAQQLAGAICAVHPLNPTHRGQRMAELLEQCRSEPKLWRQAAKELSRRLPQIASLEPTLVERLYARPMELKRAAKGAKADSAMAIEAPIATPATKPSIFKSGEGYFLAFSFVVATITALIGSLKNHRSPLDVPASVVQDARKPFGDLMEREHWAFMQILKKSDAELTIEDKNKLILLGFANEDSELTSEQQVQLSLYDLFEPRQIWRKHHAPLPKRFISEQPQPVHAKPQPANKS
jgi:hypothetical protein